jgi:hypothetical protein
MSLALLGIAHDRGGAELPRIIELGDGRLNRNGVFWIADDDLAAAVMPSLRSPLGPMTHATLLETIHRQVDILPARYGVELPDKKAVYDFLRQRRPDLLNNLARLRGTGEFGLRIAVSPSPAQLVGAQSAREYASSFSPSQYLTERRRQYECKDHYEAEEQQAADRCVQVVANSCREHRRLPSGQLGVVRLAFLVERPRWDAFRNRAELFRQQGNAASCTVLGPWPPYSFV